MKITDNGKGFDPGIPKTGNGLSTMKNRAQQLGGQFHISSVTGSGTVISVTIPFSKLTLDGNSNHLN
jgi:signal transduction histidine kinase